MDNYEVVNELGSGNFGVTHLMKDKTTGEMVAVKKLPRGSKINKNVYREVLNHRKLSHPNIIGFKSVLLDEKHLNIVMEYAQGAVPSKLLDSVSLYAAELSLVNTHFILLIEFQPQVLRHGAICLLRTLYIMSWPRYSQRCQNERRASQMPEKRTLTISQRVV